MRSELIRGVENRKVLRGKGGEEETGREEGPRQNENSAADSRNSQQPHLARRPTLLTSPLDHLCEITTRLITHGIQEPYTTSNTPLVHSQDNITLFDPIIRVRGFPG
jgi:hypothetical protein